MGNIMKKSANEILSHLEQRINLLEKQAQNKIAKKYKVETLKPGFPHLGIIPFTLSQKELSDKILQMKITKYSLINKSSDYIALEGIDESLLLLKSDLIHFLLAEKGISKGR